MAFFLGIDGGATKTTCLLGDEARVLGTSRAGGCNLVRATEDVARKNLHMAIREACQAAHISPGQIARACLGAAGITATGVPDKLKAMVAELIPGCIEIVSDMDIALEAAFGRGPGVVVNAGTGSIAIGRDKNGKTARVGGWGYAISDEGSGQWIGREAIRECLRWHDKGEDKPLLKQIMKAWRIHGLADLVRVANSVPPPNFSELLPCVIAASDGGDPVARDVLRMAAAHLDWLTDTVIKRLWAPDLPKAVAMVGSVFRCSEEIRNSFTQLVHAAHPQIKVLPDLIDPAMGALARARNAAL